MKSNSVSATRHSRTTHLALVFVGVCALVFASAPLWAGANILRLLTDFFLYLSLACLWNFLVGYAGLVSIGQQAFVGLGAYGLFTLSRYTGLNPLVSVLIASVVVAALSIPFAALLFRLKGAYFAISSWVLAEVLRLTAQFIPQIGGSSGMSLPIEAARALGAQPAVRFTTIYLAAFIALLMILSGIYFTLQSRTGLALTAIRDNELAARSNGVNANRTKLIVYVLTAFGTAATGGLIFLQRLRVTPDSAFSISDWTALVIFMVVIGGVGTFEGPIIGAVLFFLLRGTLADFGPFYMISLGAVAILIMIYNPRGLWGHVRDRWHLQLLPLNFRILSKQDS
ncbi:branched-chain amino acid ABC transporter permease [Metarhizobium album]|uniref:Branched-chain amino acid ABC transporter permease n=1 Tax=Metarhizobium album TaxID=2182425 RepID=A0A2U2DJE6_9HYPH|nr:branched-chain amino acid ABC transporter permease [Rhizobium album]PWE53424.1 branched-chain amino acid ABC transporter permease [Rhizobium album]